MAELFHVHKAPPKALYIPNFISEEEEKILLQKVYEAPKPKWVHLSNRRLQNWGGLPHPKGMVAEPLPPWLKSCMTKVDALNLFNGNVTNHVLVNEYLSGQGIMPHEDGPLFYPTISTINLGSHTLLDIYKPFEEDKLTEHSKESLGADAWSSRRVGSFLLERRSLLVLEEDLYVGHLHGIAERRQDALDATVLNLDATSSALGDVLHRQTRVSLTIRHFPKVFRFKMPFK